MRITIPAIHARTLRIATLSNGETIRLVTRRLNKNPTYFVIYGTTVLHMGKRKHAVRMFNAYVPVRVMPKVQVLSA